jgi:hypothetical protein
MARCASAAASAAAAFFSSSAFAAFAASDFYKVRIWPCSRPDY